jgi:hypothetical protein
MIARLRRWLDRHRAGARCPGCGVDSTPSIDADYEPAERHLPLVLTRTDWNMILLSLNERGDTFDVETRNEIILRGDDYHNLARRIRAAIR